MGFKDKKGTTCAQTDELGKCKDGIWWKKEGREELMEDANSQGLSVLDACCACGGGNQGVCGFILNNVL